MDIKCNFCDKQFSTIISYVKRGGGKFCSIKCFRLSHNTVKKCKTCKKEFTLQNCRTKNRPANFCSRECWNKSRFGTHLSKKHKDKISKAHTGKSRASTPYFKGRIYQSNGYVLLFKPEHPFSSKQNYILEHRFIAEQKLNRFLTDKEIIHHINGIRDDNRPENLHLFPNISAHRKCHSEDQSLVSNIA